MKQISTGKLVVMKEVDLTTMGQKAKDVNALLPLYPRTRFDCH